MEDRESDFRDAFFGMAVEHTGMYVSGYLENTRQGLKQGIGLLWIWNHQRRNECGSLFMAE